MGKSALEYAEAVLPLDNLPEALPNKGKHFVFFNVDVDREDLNPRMKAEIEELIRQRVQLIYPGRDTAVDKGAINPGGWMINILISADA